MGDINGLKEKRQAMEYEQSFCCSRIKSKVDCPTGQLFRTKGNKILLPQSSMCYRSRLPGELQFILYSHPNTSKELSRHCLYKL